MRRTESARRDRAHRLLRWYPKEWRSRYGEEFVELLVADMEERPQSRRRALNVALNGIMARSAAAGLGGQPLDSADDLHRVRPRHLVPAHRRMAVVATQHHGHVVGHGRHVGGDRDLRRTLHRRGLSVLWSVGRRLGRDRTGPFVRPLLLTIGGFGVLLIGTHHFANGWPGTGGHAWVHQGMVPGGVAAYAWASTLFVTSYWAHPIALSGVPIGEVAWMVVGPAALIAALVGTAKLVRRLELSSRVLHYERRLAYGATLAMATFLTGAGMWVFDGGPGPRNLFHVGAIDVVDLVAMTLAIAMAGQAVHRVGLGARRLSSH